MPGALPTIHMQNLAGHEPGVFQVDNRLDDITHLAHMPYRVQLPERCMVFFARRHA